VLEWAPVAARASEPVVIDVRREPVEPLRRPGSQAGAAAEHDVDDLLHRAV
jgi:hypothetical protein